MTTINETEAAAHHLEELFNDLYSVLGARAGGVHDDAVTIALHVMAREFGEVAATFRDLGPHRAGVEASPLSSGVIAKVLNDALDTDDSGVIALYAICVEILPRLLISLRDVAEILDHQQGGRVIDRARRASAVVMAQLHASSDLLRTRGSEEILGAPAARYADWLRDAGADERF